MTAVELNPIQPDERDIDAASSALVQVKRYLEQHRGGPDRVTVRVVDAHDGELVVPRGAVELLARILAYMAEGRAVSVVPAHAELTTQQAADLLNVSRPYLIGLLTAGEIEYRKVGSHRRVMMSSLVDYLRKDDQRRRSKADELTALTREMGLE
ncbi:MAG: helix-turn-helix domain-containing protein [Actinobacteria bacterium]|nr:helix-turn-helix domain-containing protein [Actinomycetota bacterium]